MATPATTGLQFVFSAVELKALLDKGPEKIVFTITVEPEVTKTGSKVGALKINAKGTFKGKKKAETKGGGGLAGCPVPPCNTN